MHLYHFPGRWLRDNISTISVLFVALISTAQSQDLTTIPVQYHAPYISYAQNLTPASPLPVEQSHSLLKSLPAQLHSEIAYVQDLETATTIYDKNSQVVRPIASITKLMTALIVLEAAQDMSEPIVISNADIDRLKNTTSRLSVGSKLSRAEMLQLALMSSENRAANALGRYYPGGITAFVRAMNDKARALGMRQTRFVEPTGLSSENVASPRDLVLLMQATAQHPLIQQYTTSDQLTVSPRAGRQLVFGNTNRLVQNSQWDIQVSKTGFINEAGQCLVLLTKLEGRQVAIVLLNAQGRYSRIGDAIRIRHLVEDSNQLAML